MKKSHIALAALPVIFGAAGFGAGQMFDVKEPVAIEHAEADGRTDAEKVLDGLAQGETHKAAETHGPASHNPDDAHAPAQHDAQLIPAKATGHAAQDDHAPAANKSAAHAVAKSAPKVGGSKPESRTGAVAVDLRPEARGTMSALQLKDSKVIQLGRVTVPVQRAASVTYIVSDIGVSVDNLDSAAHFNMPENATRLRDAILMSMHRIAGTPALQGANIDTEDLAETMSADLKNDFGDQVGEVLFLTMFKADVPRS
ncbi:hypothetical protein ATO6_20305 [Oceanicola sp. 22II-s10i]|uniref:hypothetical protein n=1 Tax=Oceanicola sp. 22II-s10i TaxID=1317116 RepID=UPI000B524FD8|nr:hypothetical protein [Oceanicola sp. 22II-s10i]OWU83185.1 hypothetical protein ATO6_20305 [Oceanicola sp. 22II-s10i]